MGGYIERFNSLISSYEKNGYDDSSEIELYADLHLHDGSHRIAMALYHKAYLISCKVRSDSVDIFYCIEWFIEKGFDYEEIKLIKEKYHEIANNINVPFVCTLWPPVQNYFDEITRKISLVAEILEYKDYFFDEHTFSAMIKGIYAVDDIAQWKIDKKIEMMQFYPSKKMRLILLNIDNPVFRLKECNSNTLSSTCEVIKRIIRNAYKDRIENYFYDIIMHIGDNYYQNIFINNLFNTSIDVKGILETIKNYNYVITKFNVPYMPDNFPENYPLNKDIDIICNKDDYENIKNAISSFLEKSNHNLCINKVVKKNNEDKEYRALIRCELYSYLIFQFDIAYQIGGIKDSFISDMVNNKQLKNNFFISSIEYEIVIRLQEIHKYPYKKHHLDFVKSNLNSINKNLCDKYLDFEWENEINANIHGGGGGTNIS
jgi:hypothetical protein